MVPHPERRRGTWATPFALTFLAAMFGVIGWGGDKILTDVKDTVVDIKAENINAHQKLWEAFTSSEKRIDCIQNQLAKCCKDSSYCV